jgi:hypothetical protein
LISFKSSCNFQNKKKKKRKKNAFTTLKLSLADQILGPNPMEGDGIDLIYHSQLISKSPFFPNHEARPSLPKNSSYIPAICHYTLSNKKLRPVIFQGISNTHCSPEKRVDYSRLPNIEFPVLFYAHYI